jgi:3',5'-cyclic AMP phosphodiesterase CpdA
MLSPTRLKTILHITLATLLLLTGCSTPPHQTAASKNIARIALLADPHVNRETNGLDASFKPHFETAIAQVNAADVDLVLIAGDLTQSGRAEEMADFQAQIKKFHAPVWYVPGNHDVGNKLAGTNGTATAARTERYEQLAGPSWFSRSLHGVRVIGINSPILGSGFPSEERMWKFLEAELGRPAGEPTFLLTHYPLFVTNLDEPGGGYWNIEPAPRQRLYALLNQGGVKAVFSGHLHRSLNNQYEGILFLTVPPISFGLPKGKQPEGWVLVTVQKNGEVQEAFQPLLP